MRAVSSQAKQQVQSRYLSEEEVNRLIIPDEKGALPVTLADGFFVYQPTGQKFPAANQTMTAYGVVSFRLRGTQYHAGHRTANTSPCELAMLRREPTNAYDPNAVAVYALLPHDAIIGTLRDAQHLIKQAR